MMHCASFGWNWPIGRSFIKAVTDFHYVAIISPWKKAWPFIWTKLNLAYPRMFYAKFGRNWPSGFGKEDKSVKTVWQGRRMTNFDQKSSLENRYALTCELHILSSI